METLTRPRNKTKTDFLRKKEVTPFAPQKIRTEAEQEALIEELSSLSNHNMSLRLAEKYLRERYSEEEIQEILAQRGQQMTIALAMELCDQRYDFNH